METNLEIWNKVKTPDPKHVKSFKRAGGFNGSATNTQYVIQRATELWGPNGQGWGLEITQEQYIEGAPIFGENGDVLCREIIHVIRGKVWYMRGDEKHQTSEQYGQTTFVGKNKYGPFTDEEAPKKSVTDMMLKCLSLLGFSADIFLGLWDDNKYVNDVRKKMDNKGDKEAETAAQNYCDEFKAQIDEYVVKSIDEWTEFKASGEIEKAKKKLQRFADLQNQVDVAVRETEKAVFEQVKN